MRKKSGLQMHVIIVYALQKNTHAQLLTKAIESLETGKDIDIVDYYVCDSCGFLHASTSELKRCPGCGADKFKLQKI